MTFNFPHNLLKGIVDFDALFKATPSILTLNHLLSGLPRDEELTALRVMFRPTLMSYARASPCNTIAGKVTPTINYDPFLGLREYQEQDNRDHSGVRRDGVAGFPQPRSGDSLPAPGFSRGIFEGKPT